MLRVSDDWIRSAIRAEVSPEGKVIDLGCGPGKYLDALTSASKVFAVDAHEPYVAQARDRGASLGLDAKYIVDDIRKWLPKTKLPAGQHVDLCVLIDVLEHMSHDEACNVLAECSRLSRRIIALIPLEGESNGACVRGEFTEAEWQWQAHRHAWTHDDVNKLLPDYKEVRRYRSGALTALCVWRKQ